MFLGMELHQQRLRTSLFSLSIVFFGSCFICLYLSDRKNIFNKTIILGYISTSM